MGNTPHVVHSCNPPLGNQIIHTVRGPVATMEVPGMATSTARQGTDDESIVVLLYDPDAKDDEGNGLGFATQLSPDAARTMAASLLKLAEQLQPMVRQ